MFSDGLLLLIVLCSIIGFTYKPVYDGFKFSPYRIWNHKQYYRFFTFSFIHLDFLHLLLNAIVLFTLVRPVELQLVHIHGPSGRFIFLMVYFAALVFSASYSFFADRKVPSFSAVGASGGLSALVFGYIIFYPNSTLKLFLFGDFEIPAFLIGMIYLFYSWYKARQFRRGSGHEAHWLGGVFGLLVFIAAYPAYAAKLMAHLLGIPE
jgi:membrane associated rhomboid family serine protease